MLKITFCCAGLLASLGALGQSNSPGDDRRLESIVISATREPASGFDLPVSVSRVERSRIQDMQALVNLSESLAVVPGLNIQNRQNFAQDLQISLRGFGARASFGVRGIRLLTDGIPATAPDGQGQISHFDLGSAGHIEVLRGPFSALYGNASGGVIALYTETPPSSLWQAAINGGSYGSMRAGIKAGGQAAFGDYLADVAHFATDGYRAHSETDRDNVNAKLDFTLGESARLGLVLNGVRLDAQDPLGLDRQQFALDPRSVAPVALQFDTRKEVTQSQLGATYDVDFDADKLSVLLYGGDRSTTQFLAIPISAQQSPAHSGGVVDLDRGYWGSDAHWTHRPHDVDGDAAWRLTAGISYDDLREHRRGYENFVGSVTGIQGRLRRDEINTVVGFDQYAQWEWEPGTRWLLLAGLRHSDLKFHSDDRYIVPGNGDDSGEKSFEATTPVLGLTFKPHESWRLHAAYGRGFETPTTTELAYRSTGAQTGLNLGLQAAHSDQYEVGAKYSHANTAIELTGFVIDARDELAVLANSGGRAVYQNIGATRRRGIELSSTATWGRGVATNLAYTHIDARYRTDFTSCNSTPCVPAPVSAGNRIPGIPAQIFYAELTWQYAPAGLTLGAEVRAVDRLFVDDFNRESAPGYATFGARAQLEQRHARWRFVEFLRVDNLADRRYAGSVIVNESNQRYYEPAAERSYLLGFTVERR